MKTWLRNSLIAAAALAVVLAGAYWWLAHDGGPRAEPGGFEIDIERLRALAAELPGEGPEEIRAERVAAFGFPAVLVTAGDGFDTVPVPIYAYQLVWPERTMVLDTAISEPQGGGFLTGLDEAARDRMHAAMAEAEAIVLTHEHPDHIGGLAGHPDLAGLAPNVRMTAAQIANTQTGGEAPFPEDVLAVLDPLAYDGAAALAPGVAVLAAPGHSPGSQIVFVRSADGREYLFIGDIAWHQRNLDTGRTRPRLMTDYLLSEDRGAVLAQLAAIDALRADHPEVAIIPGHDDTVAQALIAEGALEAEMR